MTDTGNMLTPLATAFANGRVTSDNTLARQTATHYAEGDDAAATEAAFLRDGVGIVDTGWRDLLAVSGADALSFLHRMLTQELQKLEHGRARRSALLLRKGQLVAEMLAVRPTPDNSIHEAIWLDVGSGRGAAVSAGLNPFVITEDVTFTPLDERETSLWLVGPAVGEMLKAAGVHDPAPGEAAGDTWHDVPMQLVGHPLGALAGVRIRVSHDGARALWPRLVDLARNYHGGPAGFRAFETARIEQGVGRFGREWTEQVLPKEAGLDECISYTKGCFVGQEPTARLHFRGQPARRLMRLQIAATSDAAALPPGTPLLDSGGREAGTLTSAIWSAARGAIVALGFVKRAHLGDDAVLHAGAPDGPPVVVAGTAGADTPK